MYLLARVAIVMEDLEGSPTEDDGRLENESRQLTAQQWDERQQHNSDRRRPACQHLKITCIANEMYIHY